MRINDVLKEFVIPQGVMAEGVGDLGYDAQSLIMKLRRDVEEKRLQPTRDAVLMAARELAGDMEFAPELLVQQVLGQGVMEYDKYPNKNSETKWWENPEGLKKELGSDDLSPSNHKTQSSPIQRDRQEFPLKLKEKQGVAEATGRLPDPQNYDSDWDYYNDRDAEEPKDDDADYENMIDEPSDDWFDESKQKVGNMDADKFDDALARMKKLAGSGPLKTVWDPAKRVYRNMPTAVQPRK
jgi:hypothetical protein